MYKLANIICTTICALSLTQAFSDEVGFIPDHEITLSSPLDSNEPMTAFPTGDHSFVEPPAVAPEQAMQSKETSSLALPVAAAPAKKAATKQVAVKPFTGKVKAKKLRMRVQADLDGAIVRDLTRGELVAVVGEKGDFWAVEAPAGLKAYVFRSYILDNVVEGNKVNVRLKPTVDSPILAHLNSGDRVSGTVCSTNNKWMEIAVPSNVTFYVAKQYIENVGSPDIKAHYDSRRHAAMETLESAQYLGKVEFTKSFPEIDFEKVTHNFQTVVNDYAEFTELATAAREELSQLQERYIDKRLSYVESQPSAVQEESLASSELASSSQLLQAVTDKMKLWEPIEESLYLSWSSINESRTLDEYYTDQKLSATPVTGILEPYTAPVKCKPGDFIIRDKDLPVAYVYSTQVNLQSLVGKKVTLMGAPRPNNNFAFPAYFVLSAE